MCLPQVIKSFQNYRGVATTFYPTLVYSECVTVALVIWNAKHIYRVIQLLVLCVYVCVCVCLYVMFFTLSHNFDIISVSSHPIEYLLYVVAMIWDISCFVTWQRKHIFLYDTHSEVRSGKHGGMEEYNITYSVCVCVCVLRYPACKAQEMFYVSIGWVSASNWYFRFVSQTARCSGKKLLNTNCVLVFSRIYAGKILIVSRINRNITKNLVWFSRKGKNCSC